MKAIALLFSLIFTITTRLTASQTSKINITTLSTTDYDKKPATSIYPAFADGLAYTSWTETGSKPYYQLTAVGGSKPLQWSISKGSLPDGISLTADGKIQGTPSVPGKFSFVVKVVDANQQYSDKALEMTVEHPRSAWLSDAKFGMWFPLGPFSTLPAAQTKQEIAMFEKKLTKFNADEWVDVVIACGGKVINVSAKAGDGIRMWPSISPSTHELKLNRNIIAELITASHKKGIKLVASFAPDHTWNKKVNDTAPDGTWGTLNKGLIRELVEMGVDGLWIDMGGTPELYPKDVDPKWFPWNEILSVARTINPRIIFSNNPGIQHGGTALRWPDTDVLVYEGLLGLEEKSLAVAKPSVLPKKVAIEVDNLLDSSWSWTPVKNPKEADMIIKNIEANWKVGATYILVVPPSPDGNIQHSAYTSTLSKIGSFVRNEQSISKKPVSSLNSQIIYNSPKSIRLTASQGSKIYYTTDGTLPSVKSKLYQSPIIVNKTTRLRAISHQTGKRTSIVFDEQYKFTDNKVSSTRNRQEFIKSSKTTGISTKDQNSYYRGMKFTIGPNPITVDKIGRQYIPGNENTHSILLKTFTDNSPVLTADINTNKAIVESDGYQYVEIKPTILKAGVTYIVASKEDSTDKFIGSQLIKSPSSKDFRITSYAILSTTGDPQPVKDDGIGSLLNLKYLVERKTDDINLALGAAVSFEDNNEKPLPPWMGRYYVENAVDNDISTRAQAGGQYAWNLKVDLGKVKNNIKKVTIIFPQDAYATHFQLLSSTDGNSWKVIQEKVNNSDLQITLKFQPTNCRYLKLKALKPDGPNQKGNGMGILEFKIF